MPVFLAIGAALVIVAVIVASSGTTVTTSAATYDSLAASLGVPASWLRAVIMHESMADPLAVNLATHATGIFQVMPSTAAKLGLSSAIGPGGHTLPGKTPASGVTAILAMPFAVQLALFGRYLALVRDGQWSSPSGMTHYQARPLNTLQSVAMAVFYPEAWNWPMAKAFPATVQAANPGIKTVGDYMMKVQRFV